MKVAFIGDKRGKVQHYRYEIFQKHLPIDFKFFSDKDVKGKSFSEFDAVYYASITYYIGHPIKHKKIFGSATSWKCVTEKGSMKILPMLNRFSGVSANNKMLCKKLKKHRPDIWYLPNGVDCEVFFPERLRKYDPQNIVIGWVGNIDRKEKNYDKIIVPLMKLLPPSISMKTVLSKKSDSHKSLQSKSKMRGFYNSIDYFLVSSSYEGTPNPALEAMACGTPVISTPVGNMVDVINEGKNGFMTECNLANIRSKLLQLSGVTLNEYTQMNQRCRDIISSDWQWSQAAKRFAKFFGVNDA